MADIGVAKAKFDANLLTAPRKSIQTYADANGQKVHIEDTKDDVAKQWKPINSFIAWVVLAIDPHQTQAIVAGTAGVSELDSSRDGGRGDQWHIDVTFVAADPKASILRAVGMLWVGGDTIWANTATACEDLPATLQTLADKLCAVHSNTYAYAAPAPKRVEGKEHRATVFASPVIQTQHQYLRVQLETGEHGVLSGSFVKCICRLAQDESRKIFKPLQAHVTAPDNTVRWRWQAGDVVIWGKRATQPCAFNDYADQHRVVRRATIAGDVLVGIDGRRCTPRVKP